jgi:hypothetical protein
MEDQPVPEQVQGEEHAPHAHARSRTLTGVAAVCIVLALTFVWFRWGEDIKRVCTGGSNGACTVDLSESAPVSEGVAGEQFNQ